MRLQSIAKFGGILSVILFLIGVGMYCFAKLTEVGDGRNMDLLTLVPNDCIGVFETDNLDYFSNAFPHTSYAKQLDTLRNSSIVHSVLSEVTRDSAVGTHRLGNQMNRFMVSFHSVNDIHAAVIYFRMTQDTKDLLSELVTASSAFAGPKTENYRGEKLRIYPCGSTRFITVYNGAGFLAVSYHKRLIERVVDADKDGTSLRNDETFSNIQRSKSANYMTFYGKTAALPVLSGKGDECWSEFNIHMNSDVFYLSGVSLGQEECLTNIRERLDRIEMIEGDSFLVASGQHEVDSCISEAIISPHNTLFDECVSNLSRDASYIMVADLDKVVGDIQRYEPYIPVFIKDHLPIFKSFILSVQVTKFPDRLSHIFVFTYKN